MTTVGSDVVERVTSYIKHNATKEPAALRAIVDQGHARLVATLDGMSDAQGRFKPAPDVWSALECLHHVASAKGGVARICERLARGERIAGQGREGDEQDGMVRGEAFTSVTEARAAIEAAHKELQAFIDGALSGADVEARFNHFVFGDLNCREWAAFQRVHDGDHANQIEQVRSAPGYPAS